MKKSVIFLFIILLCGSLFQSQAYKGRARLKGNIKDEQGNPIEGVNIKLYLPSAKGGLTSESNAKGEWKANWLRKGNWEIDFEKSGYEPKQTIVTISEIKKNPFVEIVLKTTENIIVSEDIKDKLEKGNAIYEQKKYDEAETVFREVLEANPDIHIININIGNCCFQQEQYDEAIACYKKVLEKESDNVSANIGIGNAYANKGENEKALDQYSKIELDKINDPTVLYNIGTNYLNLSKLKDALKYYERAVSLDENFLDGIYQLGLTYLTIGEKEKAVAQFEKYLEKDQESAKAGQVRSFLEYLKK